MTSSNKLSRKVSTWFAIIIRNVALLLIEIYRLIGAPFLGGACRFEPSCSVYAQEAFRKHDPFFAFLLTLKRLGRCRPGGPYGFDPVPDAPCSCAGGHHEYAK